MKTKLSKRVLSVILAVMMIVTSIPMMAITAFAADDALVNEVETAMTAYETKMQSGKIYTNMNVAYEAYVNCQKALDAYNYGGVTDALSGKADALNSATNAMTEWSMSFTATAYHTTSVATDGYSNVVYTTSSTSSDQTIFSDEANDAGIAVKYAIPKSIVIAYDGENEASIPAVLETRLPDKTMCNSQKIHYAESNNGTMYFDGVWNGYMDGTWQLWPKDNIATEATLAAQSSDSSHIHEPNNKNTSRFWWNKLAYHGTGNTTDYYDKISNVGLTVYCYFDNWGDKYTTLSPSVTNEIFVINYAPVKNLIKSYQSALTPVLADKGVSKYKEGGLTDIINAISNLTAINPNTYDYSNVETGVQACASDIKTAVAANSNKSVGVEDSAGYQAIRDVLPQVRPSYNAGESAYRSGWAEFEAAYNTAVSIMANLPSTGYNDNAAAQTAADNLMTAYNNLELNVSKIDTTELVTLINTFEGYENIFTSETYNNALTVVANAKVAVWQAEENFPAEAYALDDTAENETIYANQITAVQAAIRALRISPDAKVQTDYGYYSLNEARALTPSHPQSDYTNYELTFGKALETSAEYIATIPNVEMTDYNAQHSEYVSMVNTVVKGYNDLALAFTLIDDGTVSQVGAQTITNELYVEDMGRQYIGFSYSSSAVVIKTTHAAQSVDFGNAYIQFATNIKTGALGAENNNNMLDSISINTSVDQPSNNGHIDGTAAGSTSTPKALSDAQKTGDYAGCLTNGPFELTKLTYDSLSNNCNPFNGSTYITGKDGTVLASTKEAAIGYDVTDLLATSEGKGANPAHGGVFAKSSNGNKADVNIKANMTINIPATTAAELSSTTKPNSVDYKLQSYFGALTTYNVQNTTSQAGQNWITTKSKGEMINCTVSVVDASYLFDLIEICDAIVEGDGAQKYTAATYNRLLTQLSNAKTSENLDISTLPAATITSRLQTRYSNLWAAYTALKLNTFPITFNYKDANGADASTSITATYGTTLADYETQINAITTPDYVSGAYTYSFDSWTPAIDMTAPITAAATYTAQYNATENAIDFTAYNEAKAQLLGSLTDDTYFETEINQLIADIGTLKYFNYTAEQQAATPPAEQTAVNAETETINNLKNGLTPCTQEYKDALDVAKAAKEEAQARATDKDRYNVSGIDNFNPTKTVTVAGDSVSVLVYDTKQELEDATRDALNSVTVMTYSIYLGETEIASNVPYGTKVIVNSDGTVSIDVQDVTTNYDGANASWTYCYSAPSTNGVKTASKYVLTSPSIGFTLKGNTYLTATTTEASDSTYLVTVKTNTGNIIDISTTSGSYVMPTAPNYAFYTFTGYSNGAAAGDTITVSQDTTITANYEADTATRYTISYAPSFDELINHNVTTDTYAYNEKVTLPENPDAFAWAILDIDDANYRYFMYIISYGTSYSFYACQSYEMVDVKNLVGKCIVPITEDEYNSYIQDSTVFTKIDNTTTGTGAPMSDADALTDGYVLVKDALGNTLYCPTCTYRTITATTPNSYEYPAPPMAVSSLDQVVPIYNGNVVEKFSMVGTYTLPQDCEIVECGFLFTSDTTVTSADMIVENVGQRGIARMKSTRYTCGNQFVINIINHADRELSFKYEAYAIVKDSAGNLTTVYATPYQGTNVF